MIKDKNIDLGVWKNFLPYLKPYRKDFITLSLFMILLGFLDSIFPLLNKYAIDNFIIEGNLSSLKAFILVLFLLVLVLAIAVYSFISLAGKIEAQMSFDLRKLGFEKLQTLSISYYNDNPVGSTMSKLTSDITRLSETISWGIVDLAWGLSLMGIISIIILRLNLRLALIIFFMLPFLVIISSYFRRKMLKAQRSIRKINGNITAAFNEDIQGAKTTKTLGREDLNLMEFKEESLHMKEKSIRFLLVSSIYIPLVLVFGSLVTGLILTFGGRDLMVGAISYGSLIAFIAYTSQFFEPINQIAIVLSDLQGAQASAERFFDLVNTEAEIKDDPSLEAVYGSVINPNTSRLGEIKGDIEFDNVSFYYKEEELVLKNFNLKLRPGETLALVGETGSGKSTIVNLVARFYEPKSGRILIDSKDYRSLPQSLIHQNLGYVLQSPQLFNGSILENIRYGNLEASEEDIIGLCKTINAHDFIMSMEDGYNSSVGEGGGFLSTGQKQLISIARALIKDPKIFILDEATSSVDTETERIIQDAISKALKGRTSFVIAHRLSTIRNADRIVVLKKGEILEIGNHKELLAKKSHYYKLYKDQFIEDKNKEILS